MALRRIARVIAAAAAALVFIGSLGGYVVVKWFDGHIARIHLSLGTDRPAEAAAGTENWLLVGTDAGRANVPGQRSDSTILTHLDADGTTTNLSFPRDTLVRIPAYRDSKGSHPAEFNKFNHAIQVGGPDLLIRTVEQLTNIRIDHYVSVDLNGFRRIANALGGVSVCILHSDAAPDVETENGVTHVSTNIDDSFSGFHGHDGTQVLNGDQALAFVRQRHGLPESDLSRIQRQQQFLGSVFRNATSTGVLVNPIKVAHLLSAVSDALTLDDHTSISDLEALASRLRGVDPSKIRFETAPTRGLTVDDTNLGTISGSANVPELTPKGQTEDVGNVLLLEERGFQDVLNRLSDRAQTPAASTSVSAPSGRLVSVKVAPQQVTVTVLNGSGRSHLADSVTQALGDQDFTTGAPGPAASSRYAQSEVHYAPGQKDAAKTVAAAVPGSVLTEDPSVTSGVVLILGDNFTDVQPVTVGGQPMPTASPTPAPSGAGGNASSAPPAVTAASAGNRCTY